VASAQTPFEACPYIADNGIANIDFDGCVEQPCAVSNNEPKTVKITFKSREYWSLCVDNEFFLTIFSMSFQLAVLEALKFS